MKFSLSTLLIGIGVIAVVLAFVVMPLHRTWRIASLKGQGVWCVNLHGRDTNWWWSLEPGENDVKFIGTHGDGTEFSTLYDAVINFPEVQRVSLLRRQVTLEEVKAICQLQTVTEIDLRSSPVDSEILTEILRHPHIRGLFLGDIYLDEETLNLLCGSQWLEVLAIDDSNVHDADLLRLCKMASIKKISAMRSEVGEVSWVNVQRQFPHIELEASRRSPTSAPPRPAGSRIRRSSRATMPATDSSETVPR